MRCYVCEKEIEEGTGMCHTRFGEAHYACHAKMPYDLIRLNKGLLNELRLYVKEQIGSYSKVEEVPQVLMDLNNSIKPF